MMLSPVILAPDMLAPLNRAPRWLLLAALCLLLPVWQGLARYAHAENNAGPSQRAPSRYRILAGQEQRVQALLAPNTLGQTVTLPDGTEMRLAGMAIGPDFFQLALTTPDAEGTLRVHPADVSPPGAVIGQTGSFQVTLHDGEVPQAAVAWVLERLAANDPGRWWQPYSTAGVQAERLVAGLAAGFGESFETAWLPSGVVWWLVLAVLIGPFAVPGVALLLRGAQTCQRLYEANDWKPLLKKVLVLIPIAGVLLLPRLVVLPAAESNHFAIEYDEEFFMQFWAVDASWWERSQRVLIAHPELGANPTLAMSVLGAMVPREPSLGQLRTGQLVLSLGSFFLIVLLVSYRKFSYDDTPLDKTRLATLIPTVAVATWQANNAFQVYDGLIRSYPLLLFSSSLFLFTWFDAMFRRRLTPGLSLAAVLCLKSHYTIWPGVAVGLFSVAWTSRADAQRKAWLQSLTWLIPPVVAAVYLFAHILAFRPQRRNWGNETTLVDVWEAIRVYAIDGPTVIVAIILAVMVLKLAAAAFGACSLSIREREVLRWFAGLAAVAMLTPVVLALGLDLLLRPRYLLGGWPFAMVALMLPVRKLGHYGNVAVIVVLAGLFLFSPASSGPTVFDRARPYVHDAVVSAIEQTPADQPIVAFISRNRLTPRDQDVPIVAFLPKNQPTKLPYSPEGRSISYGQTFSAQQLTDFLTSEQAVVIIEDHFRSDALMQLIDQVNYGATTLNHTGVTVAVPAGQSSALQQAISSWEEVAPRYFDKRVENRGRSQP